MVQLFVQYAPYSVDPKVGNWADPDFKNAFADRIFNIVEENHHCTNHCTITAPSLHHHCVTLIIVRYLVQINQQCMQ